MKEYRRYAIGVILLIAAIVLVIVGFNFVRGLFKDDPAEQQQQTAKRVNLLDAPSSNRPVRYTTKGNIVSEEEHRSVRITVDANNVRVEVLQGYGGNVIKQQETPNTQEAYKAFIAALNGAGFTNAIDPKGRGDEAQSCPQGRKFAYEIEPGASDAFRSWSTSCGKKLGTFTGNAGLVQRLFENQVSNYDQFMSGVQLIN